MSSFGGGFRRRNNVFMVLTLYTLSANSESLFSNNRFHKSGTRGTVNFQPHTIDFLLFICEKIVPLRWDKTGQSLSYGVMRLRSYCVIFVTHHTRVCGVCHYNNFQAFKEPVIL